EGQLPQGLGDRYLVGDVVRDEEVAQVLERRHEGDLVVQMRGPEVPGVFELEVRPCRAEGGSVRDRRVLLIAVRESRAAGQRGVLQLDEVVAVAGGRDVVERDVVDTV